jgi:hypothetical protein
MVGNCTLLLTPFESAVLSVASRGCESAFDHLQTGTVKSLSELRATSCCASVALLAGQYACRVPLDACVLCHRCRALVCSQSTTAGLAAAGPAALHFACMLK